jgi:hypothetical protein
MMMGSSEIARARRQIRGAHLSLLNQQTQKKQVVEVKRFNKAYVLYQCGTPNPLAAGAPPAKGVKPGMPAFEVPLYSVAAADTTVNGFLVR